MKKVVGLLLIMVALSSCQQMYRDTVTVKVIDKERVRTSESSKYLIFTDGETFENTDYLFVGKFNSSDIYGKIEVGQTYTFDVAGKRMPLMSMYRNIHKIVKVGK